MEPGVLALLAVFAFAALCVTWNWRRRRAIGRRVAALGFERCEGEQPALERAWRELTQSRSDARDRFLEVSGCAKRAAGWGMVHRFHVNEGRDTSGHSDTPSTGAHYDAYLLDVRDPERLTRARVTLDVLPPGNAFVRKLIRATIDLDPPGRPLEIGQHAWTGPIFAAYGESEGKLDDLVPGAVQERIARAAAAGFLSIHLGGCRAGFAVLPGHRDVDAEWRYLEEWF